MVTQAPKRSVVLAALAFALSCIGLIAFVWTQFGGTVPFSPEGYRITAVFPESGLLVPGADVRISGVTVGKVATLSARGVDSVVTMDIQPRFSPLPRATRAILRTKTLLGEGYVQLSAADRRGTPLADGGTLAAGHVAATQSLDQVLGSFDGPTRRSFEALLDGTSTALAGEGGQLGTAFGDLDPAATELTALAGALDEQRGNLQRVIADGATVLTTLGDRTADVRTLITAGDRVLSATAARNVALTATVDALPPLLDQLRRTLRTVNTTVGYAGPSLHALAPVAPLLRPALADTIALSGPALALLHEAPRLLDAADLALPAITRFSQAFKPAVDRLLPATEQLTPVIALLGLYHRELVTAMADLGASLQARAPADTPTGTAGYLRALATLTNESAFGQSVREPTTRSNAYFAPGELSNLGRGLLSASCANTSNTSQVPLSGGNVPCRVQPPVQWGNGIASGYYPRLKPAPGK
jgi:virulence factor Mce-like protein